MNEEHTQPQVPDFTGAEMKMPENVDLPAEEQNTPSNKNLISGPVLLVLAVVLIGILAGMYYWFTTLTVDTTPVVPDSPVERPSAEANNEPESTTAEAQADTMLTTSSSDELTAIEADIEATNLDSLDAELEAIDAELNAELP